MDSANFPAHRVPPFSGGLFVSVILVIVVGLGGIDSLLTRHGFRPSVTDTQELWTYHRKRIASNPRTCVLVGSSRIRLGFSQTVFAERYPQWKLVNLACDGSFPLAVLRDLAMDADFRGIVVCSTTAPGFLRENWEMQSDRVEHAQRSHGIEPHLKFFKSHVLEERAVPFGLQMDTKSIVLRLVRGRALQRPPVVTDANRFGYADYQNGGPHAARTIAGDQYEQLAGTDPSDWARDSRKIEPWIKAIAQRGGKVVLVRYPTTGLRWERDEELFPRARYWDRLDELTGAATVHFKDDPRLDRFDCPDESHLDRRDASAFTASLLEVLDETQLLDEP